jgi:hypothetical protein
VQKALVFIARKFSAGRGKIRCGGVGVDSPEGAFHLSDGKITTLGRTFY